MKSSSKLEQIRQLKQSIHNLKVAFPMGISKIDNEKSEKLKRLEKLLSDIEEEEEECLHDDATENGHCIDCGEFIETPCEPKDE